jgi:EAL domain-containing protein (putative c-di-GMP-specific phosphodiesterase class I)
MDDFGTGYSSLTYLRRLPVAALKLDQSFVNGVIDNAEDQAIVKGILLLAQGLGLKAIAEGVESVAHGGALMALGCTLGQGYGIARPMEPDALPGWIADYERAPLWGRAGDCS